MFLLDFTRGNDLLQIVLHHVLCLILFEYLFMYLLICLKTYNILYSPIARNLKAIGY